jgi:Domain of Unknown Function (DUF928)
MTKRFQSTQRTLRQILLKLTRGERNRPSTSWALPSVSRWYIPIKPVVIGLAFCLPFGTLPIALASTSPPSTSLAQQKLFGIRLPNPVEWLFGGRERPAEPSDRRRGGATRDQCPPTGDRVLTALVPSSESDLEPTRTIAGRPTFWFYVPFRADQERMVEFVIIDENEEDFYRGRFSLTDTPGIVKIQLPEQSTLEEDKLYRWVFSVICNPANRSGDITVDGWVRRVRVDHDLEALASAPLRDQAIAYANKRLWHETLNALAALRLANPQDEEALQAWRELLENVDLGAIADEPITSCCQPQ